MALIEFTDYPNTDTPISAENLNHNFAEIVESGSNENGSWTKWADGTMIVRQTFSRTINVVLESGPLYYISVTDIPSYPIKFTSIDSMNLTMFNNNCLAVTPYSNDKTTGSHLDQCCTRILVYAPEVYENETVLFNVIAIGKWK